MTPIQHAQRYVDTHWEPPQYTGERRSVKVEEHPDPRTLHAAGLVPVNLTLKQHDLTVVAVGVGWRVLA